VPFSSAGRREFSGGFLMLAKEVATVSDPKTQWSGSAVLLQRLMEIARASALAEMASGVAHELNQPLGAIATYSQAGERMLNRPEPMVNRALDVFRQISQEALGAGEGIKRIRRLFEHRSPDRTPCQMSEIIEELRPVLDGLALRANGVVSVRAQQPLPDLLIDRTRIQHVLYALTDNAVDASSSRSASPSIQIDISADQYSVETGISDVGSGIPPDVQSHLFRPFYTTKAQGTGLGLASSRAIIESHDGTIGFENLPAGGSRFWFRLPRAAN
jgi:C4-dicarboxylate-specific signal transduction histidine kinase